jgi:hypothetical protein
MPSPKRSWRVIPNRFVEHHVTRLARDEGRSLSNMCARLLSEALHARLRIEARRTDHDDLVAAIRGTEATQQ